MTKPKQIRDYTLSDYLDYSDKATKRGTALQAVLAGGQLATSLNLASNLKVDKPNMITPGTISLNSFDVRTGATRALDKSFNTTLKALREGGRDIPSSLVSNYSDSAQQIEEKQAAINAQTKTRSDMMNFESNERARTANAAIDAKNKENEATLRLRKTGMTENAVNRFALQTGNISDMISRGEANKFQASLLYGDAKSDNKELVQKAIREYDKIGVIPQKINTLNTSEIRSTVPGSIISENRQDVVLPEDQSVGDIDFANIGNNGIGRSTILNNNDGTTIPRAPVFGWDGKALSPGGSSLFNNRIVPYEAPLNVLRGSSTPYNTQLPPFKPKVEETEEERKNREYWNNNHPFKRFLSPRGY